MATADDSIGTFEIGLETLLDDIDPSELIFEMADSEDDEFLSQAADIIESTMMNGTVGVGDEVKEENSAPPAPRFPTLTNEEIDQLVEGKESKGTKKMTQWGVNQFKQWLTSRNLPTDFEELAVPELDSTLRRFYAELRTPDGKLYSRSSYSGIRASLNRHVRSPPFNRNISLTSSDFHTSNQVYKATLKKLCTEGLDKTSHHVPISAGDLAKLRQSSAMATNDPYTLQRKVWFDVTLHFARRGCENLRDLKKDAYDFKRDDTGREYVEMRYNEKLKNHQGFENTENMDAKPRMYASADADPTDCPVASLKLYLEKLNENNEALFQQPKQKFTEDDKTWYTTRPVGQKTIQNFMAKLSEEAGLSRRYTNHCVRATSITMLSHAGVSNRAIMRITKHRNESSLKHYENDSSDAQKRQFSDIIQQKTANHSPALKDLTSLSEQAQAVVPFVSPSASSSFAWNPTRDSVNSTVTSNSMPFMFHGCTVNITNNPRHDQFM